MTAASAPSPDRDPGLTGPISPEATAGRVLDDFQVQAMAAVDAGSSVLVAAPTGAGKTVVADHAVARAVAQGGRAFYTTPIKALSNQKYGEAARAWGPDRVGLLTGDTARNGDAPVVVMTTEVLRNMCYSRPESLADLGVVVLDEVHYLQDAYRGPVWEEVIVHLDAAVQLVCLSATVSNAEELSGWIDTVHGPTATVVEHQRPIALDHAHAAFDKVDRELTMVPTLVDGRPNPRGEKMSQPERPTPGERKRRGPEGKLRSRFATPRRHELIDHLAAGDLLPAIWFVFSRKGCDQAARTTLEGGTRLTTTDEARRIRELADARVASLGDADLDILGYDPWLDRLSAGVASHHAGMVPAFKEAVEDCFQAGLVKVVFATETLALGINMPARTVVLETVTKFGGETHQLLTPAEYTQLCGRAGRRGIDDRGLAVTLWSRYVDFGDVAGLAASQEFTLRSAFRPTYNMAANLLARHDLDVVRDLLRRSFAQYQADRALVDVAAQAERLAAELERTRASASCERGDVAGYRDLIEGPNRRSRRAAISDALSRLRPGDVVVRDGRRLGVLSVAYRRGQPKVRVVDSEAEVEVTGVADWDTPPARRASISLADPYLPDQPAYQRGVAHELGRVRLSRRKGSRAGDDGDSGPWSPDGDDEAVPDEHPVAACPDAEAHLRALRSIPRLERRLARLRDREAGSRDSVVRQFETVVDLLGDWGHLEPPPEARGDGAGQVGPDDEPRLAPTERGRLLAGIFHECDLLVTEALARGLLDDLGPAELAAVVSALTYEHRSKFSPPPPWFPNAAVRHRTGALADLGERLARDERRAGLVETRAPDPTFAGAAWAWCRGEELAQVLTDEEMTGGDFVRIVRQLADLLSQIGSVAPSSATRRVARQAADAVRRGVVETTVSEPVAPVDGVVVARPSAPPAAPPHG